MTRELKPEWIEAIDRTLGFETTTAQAPVEKLEGGQTADPEPLPEKEPAPEAAKTEPVSPKKPDVRLCQRYDDGIKMHGAHIYPPRPTGSTGDVGRNYCHGGYRHWSYRPGQPVRNFVRFLHNRRPLRRAVGWVFRGFRRRC